MLFRSQNHLNHHGLQATGPELSLAGLGSPIYWWVDLPPCPPKFQSSIYISHRVSSSASGPLLEASMRSSMSVHTYAFIDCSDGTLIVDSCSHSAMEMLAGPLMGRRTTDDIYREPVSFWNPNPLVREECPAVSKVSGITP